MRCRHFWALVISFERFPFHVRYRHWWGYMQPLLAAFGFQRFASWSTAQRAWRQSIVETGVRENSMLLQRPTRKDSTLVFNWHVFPLEQHPIFAIHCFARSTLHGTYWITCKYTQT